MQHHTFTHAEYYAYRTASAVFDRRLGDRAPDDLLRVLAICIIGWGCA